VRNIACMCGGGGGFVVGILPVYFSTKTSTLPQFGGGKGSIDVNNDEQ
jgi:hypothetical protein